MSNCFFHELLLIELTSMSVCSEKQTTNNKRETKTILNIELLLAGLDLICTATRGKKGIAVVV